MPLIFLGLSLALISCGKSGKDEHHDHATSDQEDDSNGALYDEVMKLHDEAMMKMDEIYKLQKELKDQIAATPELIEEKRKEIEGKISKLDSARRGMMDWMHEFHPETDSLSEQEYREYLESEMEKVKKIKDDIFDAIARAKEE
ncbi:MAG TPA: hypothetical protein VFW11_09790 [Cyclobacteriaceae bacterium]|nr:hypothetical protein [Cyclobacteriaceae bacterium]